MFLFGNDCLYPDRKKSGRVRSVVQRLAANEAMARAQRISPQEFFQLRVHPAIFGSCFRTWPSCVHDRESVVLQEDRDLLSDLYSVALDAKRLPGRGGGGFHSRTQARRVGRCHPTVADGEHGHAARRRAWCSDHGVRDGVGQPDPALCTMFTEDIFAYYGGRSASARRRRSGLAARSSSV